jgi:hypothetical protein
LEPCAHAVDAGTMAVVQCTPSVDWVSMIGLAAAREKDVQVM